MANSVVHVRSRKLVWTAVTAVSLFAAFGCNGRSGGELPATQIIAALAHSSDPLPQHLEYTYLFQNGDPTKPRFGVVPYDVRSPLWSDGAHKQRYVFVPPAERITVDA